MRSTYCCVSAAFVDGLRGEPAFRASALRRTLCSIMRNGITLTVLGALLGCSSATAPGPAITAGSSSGGTQSAAGTGGTVAVTGGGTASNGTNAGNGGTGGSLSMGGGSASGGGPGDCPPPPQMTANPAGCPQAALMAFPPVACDADPSLVCTYWTPTQNVCPQSSAIASSWSCCAGTWAQAPCGEGGAGGGGGAGGASAAVPSPGCGQGGRPADGEVSVPDDRIYSFPESYDGTTPMPAVFALHGANNPNTILQDLSNGSRLEDEFVRVFPKSNENAWRYEGGTGVDSQRLTDIYDELLANYCVDTRRIFLTGHSSGAQMSVQMLCAAGGDPRFKAAAPVAASHYCDTLTPVPVLYIQGMMDAQRNDSDGADVVAVFQTSNACLDTSMPYAAIAGCNSAFNGQAVDPGCIEYQGCSQPTIWCSHNDSNYNDTDGFQHGWPCFASNAIADFFLGLP